MQNLNEECFSVLRMIGLGLKKKHSLPASADSILTLDPDWYQVLVCTGWQCLALRFGARHQYNTCEIHALDDVNINWSNRNWCLHKRKRVEISKTIECHFLLLSQPVIGHFLESVRHPFVMCDIEPVLNSTLSALCCHLS